MNKHLLSVLSVICIGLSSCTNGGSAPSAATQKNIDAMHGVMKSFETKDFSKLSEYIAEDAVDHAGESGKLVGLEAMKADYERSSGNFESMKMEIIKELADDEYVFSWVKFTGVFKNDMMGKKAGESFESTSIEVARCKNGKVMEHWTFVEPAEMMKMMGSMEGMMPPPSDSVDVQ